LTKTKWPKQQRSNTKLEGSKNVPDKRGGGGPETQGRKKVVLKENLTHSEHKPDCEMGTDLKNGPHAQTVDDKGITWGHPKTGLDPL